MLPSRGTSVQTYVHDYDVIPVILYAINKAFKNNVGVLSTTRIALFVVYQLSVFFFSLLKNKKQYLYSIHNTSTSYRGAKDKNTTSSQS